jgi:alpha-1,2-mannosyltransferase
MLLTAVAIPLFSLALALAVLHLRGLSRLLARRPTIGFLHPYCNDGGGGERVLWVAIRELVARGIAHPDKWRMVVYTGDRIPPAELRANAKHRFGIELPESLEFVQLSCRGWIEPSRYPVATLLGQALGSILLAAEALLRAPPDILVDTTGLASFDPLVRAAGVRHLACYVHYPIVQSDMLGAVASRQAAHNNAAFFARSAARSALKLAYYRLLLCCYAHAGSHAPSWWHHSSPPWLSRLLASLSASKLGRWATEPRRAHWEAAVRP